MSTLIICAVCGKSKTASEFGDGIAVSKTTCMACAKKARGRNKPDLPPKPEKPEKPDPVAEYLNTMEAPGK